MAVYTRCAAENDYPVSERCPFSTYTPYHLAASLIKLLSAKIGSLISAAGSSYRVSESQTSALALFLCMVDHVALEQRESQNANAPPPPSLRTLRSSSSSIISEGGEAGAVVELIVGEVEARTVTIRTCLDEIFLLEGELQVTRVALWTIKDKMVHVTAALGFVAAILALAAIPMTLWPLPSIYPVTALTLGSLGTLAVAFFSVITVMRADEPGERRAVEKRRRRMEKKSETMSTEKSSGKDIKGDGRVPTRVPTRVPCRVPTEGDSAAAKRVQATIRGRQARARMAEDKPGPTRIPRAGRGGAEQPQQIRRRLPSQMSR